MYVDDETRRFRILSTLGEGSTGVVYRVADAQTDAAFAVKKLTRLEPTEIYLFKKEFRSLAGMSHPNLVELHELFVGADGCFFTMESVDGVNLLDWVRGPANGAVHDESSPRAGLTSEELGRLKSATVQLAHGLVALHEAGVLHRDVKPSNILVTRQGRVVLLDFGLIAALRGRDRRENEAMILAGTPAYMAPEERLGSTLDPAADWYSVGVILFEAVTGRVPVEVLGPTALAWSGGPKVPPLRTYWPEAPPELESLIARLLDDDPQQRAGAAEVLAWAEAPMRPATLTPRTLELTDGATLFVGREDALVTLDRVFARIQTGQPTIAHIHGPSGIGKTALVRQFCAQLEDRRALILRGRCGQQESVPYKALDRVIDDLSRHLLLVPEAHASSVDPQQMAALMRVFPVLGRVPAIGSGRQPDVEGDAYEQRRRGFLALRELLTRLAEQQPVVLWIDDVQWGDLDSAALLHEVLRPPDAPPILLLLSYRSDEPVPLLSALADRADPLPREWNRELRLGPLTAAEAIHLAGALCGGRSDLEEKVAEIAKESGGSPLFLSELARFAADQSETASPSTTPSLASVLEARARSLSESERRALDIVAVAGAPLSRDAAVSATADRATTRSTLASLERQRLLRTTVIGGQPAVEIYHDRIREIVVDWLSADDLRACHLSIAAALESQARPDLQALYQHYRGAGASPKAAHFAERAADVANDALAFDRAATLYRAAIELGTSRDSAHSSSLHQRLGEALVNAGQGAQAVTSFLAAAEAASQEPERNDEVLWLRYRAGEQLLRSGALASGTEIMRDVLGRVGVKLPRSSAAAALSSLVQRSRLMVRTPRFVPCPRERVPPRIALRLDAMWSASTALGFVDPIMVDGIGSRALREGLRVGDASRLVRPLTSEATRLASLGGPVFMKRFARYMELAEELAQRSGEPYDRASVYHCRGIGVYFRGRFRESLEQLESSLRLLASVPRANPWESTIAEWIVLTDLFWMGELAEFARRLPKRLDEAEARGDVFGTTCLRLGYHNAIWLMRDEPAEALAVADRALAPWPADRFLVAHYLHLTASIGVDLYRDDAEAAWRRLTEAWPRMRREHIFVVEHTRLELHYLRGRIALLVAMSANPMRRARLLRDVRRSAKRIAASDLPEAAPFVATLRGGAAYVEGREDEAVAQLETAVERFAAADLSLHSAAARCFIGRIAGGDAGSAALDEGFGAFAAQAVENPMAMARVLAPVPV